MSRLLATLLGCSEFGIDALDRQEPLPLQAVVQERFVQDRGRPVDLLWVVDDTPSMTQEQAVLASLAVSLVEELDAHAHDWQAGVVTMDLDRSPDGALLGAPFVLNSGELEAARQLADRLAVGGSGAGPEAGFQAALLALDQSEAGGLNAGFRRPEAQLWVLLASDDDDQSDAYLGADPVGAFLDRLAEEGDPVVVSFAGPLPGGCVSDLAEARPAPRYSAAAEALGPSLVSLCAPTLEALAPALAQLAPGLQLEFPLAAVPVAGSPLLVWVDGQAREGELRTDPPRLRLDPAPPAGAVIEVQYLTARE